MIAVHAAHPGTRSVLASASADPPAPLVVRTPVRTLVPDAPRRADWTPLLGQGAAGC
jgi:hypothetical protein